MKKRVKIVVLSTMLLTVMLGAFLSIKHVWANGNQQGFIAEHYDDIKTFRKQGSYTAPKPSTAECEDYIFAGWYKDSACSQALNAESGEAYAKFVPSEVLSVKCQVVKGTTKDSETSKLRLVTTVDTLKYQEVGFEIGFKTRTLTIPITTVLEKIVAAEDDMTYPYTPQIFSEASDYFATATMTNLDSEDFDEAFFIKPYWKTTDGTKVYGVKRFARVEDSYLGIVNVPLRVYSDKQVASGEMSVSYDTNYFTYYSYDNGDLFENISVNSETAGTIKITMNGSTNVVADGLCANVRLRFKDLNQLPETSQFNVVATFKDATGTAVADVLAVSVVYQPVAVIETAELSEITAGEVFSIPKATVLRAGMDNASAAATDITFTDGFGNTTTYTSEQITPISVGTLSLTYKYPGAATVTQDIDVTYSLSANEVYNPMMATSANTISRTGNGVFEVKAGDATDPIYKGAYVSHTAPGYTNWESTYLRQLGLNAESFAEYDYIDVYVYFKATQNCTFSILNNSKYGKICTPNQWHKITVSRADFITKMISDKPELIPMKFGNNGLTEVRLGSITARKASNTDPAIVFDPTSANSSYNATNGAFSVEAGDLTNQTYNGSYLKITAKNGATAWMDLWVNKIPKDGYSAYDVIRIPIYVVATEGTTCNIKIPASGTAHAYAANRWHVIELTQAEFNNYVQGNNAIKMFSHKFNVTTGDNISEIRIGTITSHKVETMTVFEPTSSRYTYNSANATFTVEAGDLTNPIYNGSYLRIRETNGATNWIDPWLNGIQKDGYTNFETVRIPIYVAAPEGTTCNIKIPASGMAHGCTANRWHVIELTQAEFNNCVQSNNTLKMFSHKFNVSTGDNVSEIRIGTITAHKEKLVFDPTSTKYTYNSANATFTVEAGDLTNSTYNGSYLRIRETNGAANWIDPWLNGIQKDGYSAYDVIRIPIYVVATEGTTCNIKIPASGTAHAYAANQWHVIELTQVEFNNYVQSNNAIKMFSHKFNVSTGDNISEIRLGTITAHKTEQ